MKRVTTFAGLVLILATGVAIAQQPKIQSEFTGKTIAVTDGDTIKVLVDRETIVIRLEGIDAPETTQSFGTKSKEALAKLVEGRTVTIKKTGSDKYGRTLGIVMVNGIDANAAQVEHGWAWHYKKYSKDENFAKLEIAARNSKRGLWGDANALEPWEYRARKTASAATDKRAAPQTNDSPKNAPAIAGRYWLNTKSNVRHNQKCEHYGNTTSGRPCGPNDGKACGKCGG